MDGREPYDVVVIGGGPAGMAGALWLARYERRTLLVDAGTPRNAVSPSVHGYLGLQDVAPAELRRIGRAQATAAGAEYEAARVERVKGAIDRFRVVLTDGRTAHCRRVLICTGLLGHQA